VSRSPARLVQSLGLCFDPLLKCLERFIVLLPDAAPSRPGLLPRHPVSNAVARVDILRCPEVVADQAAGQKDVEADLWVRVSAV